MDSAWCRQAGVTAAPLWGGAGKHLLREHLAESISRNGLPMLLRYEDRNSMSQSVESRVPFLTPELVTFALSLPEEYLLASDGTSKSVFREAMRGIVPPQILARRDKIGFATPESQWFVTLRPWVDAVLASDAAEAVAPLDIARLRGVWQEIASGNRPFDLVIWRAVNMIRWADHLGVAFDA